MSPIDDDEEDHDRNRRLEREQDRRAREDDRRDREDAQRSSLQQGQRLDIQVAVIEQRLRQAVIEINALHRELRLLHEDLERITNLASKYRGGLLVVLALGGLIGWLTTIYQNIMHQMK